MKNIYSEVATPAIIDWAEKLRLFKALLDVNSTPALLQRVLGDTTHKSAIGPLQNTLHKMNSHMPTGENQQAFIRHLADKLPTKNSVGFHALCAMSIIDYVQKLDDSSYNNNILKCLGIQRQSHPNVEPDNNTMTQRCNPIEDDSKTHSIRCHNIENAESIVNGVKNAHIDQKHYYMSPNAADMWSALVGSDNYTQYSECKKGLEALMETSLWKEYITARQISEIVMLAGGGAPTKDILFIDEMIDYPHVQDKLTIHLVDTSIYMTEKSRKTIYDNEKYVKRTKGIDVKILLCDILEMPAEFKHTEFHLSGKNVVYAITGGTIGNLNEKLFFESLSRTAIKDDLLILSADTVNDHDFDAERELLGKYKNRVVERWLYPVVQEVLNELRIHEPVSDVIRNNVKVDIVKHAERENGGLFHPCSIVISLHITGYSKPIILHSSARYNSDKLSELARGFGWNLVCRIPSPYNQRFQQFFFSYSPCT